MDEALRFALRIIEERAELVQRMATDARRSGRSAVAEMYEARAIEYRNYTDMIRRVVLQSLDLRSASERLEGHRHGAIPCRAHQTAQCRATSSHQGR